MQSFIVGLYRAVLASSTVISPDVPFGSARPDTEDLKGAVDLIFKDTTADSEEEESEDGLAQKLVLWGRVTRM